MEKRELVVLDPSENVGYGRSPIPIDRDSEIFSIISSAVDSSQIKLLSSRLRPEHWVVLRTFAERLASLAVRMRESKTLKVGLIALCLAGLGEDSRDALTILPLYYHAAGVLGIDERRLFSEVGSIEGLQSSRQLDAFLARKDEDKSIDAMGYRLGQDQDGFRYEREW